VPSWHFCTLVCPGIGLSVMTARSDHSDLTTCDWTDKFWDCLDLGTIYSLITEEDLCARHYRKRMAQTAQMSSEASFAGPKKPAAPVCRNRERREFGEL
jgi:hypothetical protein